MSAVPSLLLHAATFLVAVRHQTRRKRPGLCQHCGYNRYALPKDAHCPECGQPQSHTSAQPYFREDVRRSAIFTVLTPVAICTVAVSPAIVWTLRRHDDTAMLIWIPAAVMLGSSCVGATLLRWLNHRDVLSIKLAPWIVYAGLIFGAGLFPFAAPTGESVKTWAIQTLLFWAALPVSAIAGFVRLATRS